MRQGVKLTRMGLRRDDGKREVRDDGKREVRDDGEREVRDDGKREGGSNA